MNRNRKEMLYHQPPDQKSNRRSQPIDKTGRKIVIAKEEGHLPCPLYRKCGRLPIAEYVLSGDSCSGNSVKWKNCWENSVEYSRLSAWKPRIIIETRCRRRLHLHKTNELFSGVYQSSTHRVVPVEHCMTEDQKADEIIGTIRDDASIQIDTLQ